MSSWEHRNFNSTGFFALVVTVLIRTCNMQKTPFCSSCSNWRQNVSILFAFCMFELMPIRKQFLFETRHWSERDATSMQHSFRVSIWSAVEQAIDERSCLGLNFHPSTTSQLIQRLRVTGCNRRPHPFLKRQWCEDCRDFWFLPLVQCITSTE